MSRPPPGLRADYHLFLPIATRWMDNDVFGHLNNVVYYSLFDTAVTHALVGLGILTWTGGSHFLMVAESGCRFHGELAFPGTVEAGVRMARLTERSVRHEIGVFGAGQGTASAEGFMVHVCVDSVARRPAPIPQAWRAALQRLGSGAGTINSEA